MWIDLMDISYHAIMNPVIDNNMYFQWYLILSAKMNIELLLSKSMWSIYCHKWCKKSNEYKMLGLIIHETDRSCYTVDKPFDECEWYK